MIFIFIFYLASFADQLTATDIYQPTFFSIRFNGWLQVYFSHLLQASLRPFQAFSEQSSLLIFFFHFSNKFGIFFRFSHDSFILWSTRMVTLTI